MELKYCSMNTQNSIFHRSNRTFMELKFLYLYSQRSVLPGSNRTFMELKWSIKDLD